MVERHLMMEEEDDLEALRLAALQTIRSRQGVRRPTASVTAHRHVEKGSFYRHISNPNLIAIVPTEPKSDTELADISPVRNGVGNVSERSTQKIEKTGKENESVVIEDSQEKEKSVKVRFRTGGKPEREKVEEVTGDESKNSTKGRTLTKKESSEEVSGNENVNFDEDELDFEGDTVALHDDEDSLDRLMDEMEQEFNEGTSTISRPKAEQTKEREIKPTNKTSAANTNISKTVKTSASSSSSTASNPQKLQSATAQKRSKSRSPTPNKQSSDSEIVYAPQSPTYNPRDYQTFPGPRRRYSPVSPSRRRSPSPKRRRSLTPPRRYSRSPVNSKSSVSSKYSRARSPYKNKHNGRRTPDSPRRRNSSSSPYRRCSVRSPPLPSKRKASPMFHTGKRKSSSPSLTGRHRRSPKRSPSRIGSQTVESKHRWRSRSPHHHRKLCSLKKRDLSTRNTRNPKQTSPPIQRADDKLNRSDKKSVNVLETKIAENLEKKQKDDWKTQELTDPKFEARRKKFESSVFVTPGNKKICLKSNDDQSQTGEIRKEISDENSLDNVEMSNNLQKPPKTAVVDIQKKKLYTQEIPSGRKVTELKREASESPPPSKKKIIINEGSCLKKRLDISSLVVSAENQHNSKGTLSVTKYYDERNVNRSPETVKSIITIQNDLIENEKEVSIPVKKILKKKKKNKELKKRKEIMAEVVEHEKEPSIESKEDKEKEINVTSSSINKSSFDLRAELSRRRAERLKGVTNPMARIVQSAFEDVVANRKKFESKSAAQDNDLMSTSSGLTFLNAKRSRRVHLLEGSSGIKSKSALNSNFDVDDEIASDHLDFTENGRKVAMNFTSQKNSSNTSLRTSSAGSGRSILRRSQV